jgi:hypothetical protein
MCRWVGIELWGLFFLSSYMGAKSPFKLLSGGEGTQPQIFAVVAYSVNQTFA